MSATTKRKRKTKTADPQQGQKLAAAIKGRKKKVDEEIKTE